MNELERAKKDLQSHQAALKTQKGELKKLINVFAVKVKNLKAAMAKLKQAGSDLDIHRGTADLDGQIMSLQEDIDNLTKLSDQADPNPEPEPVVNPNADVKHVPAPKPVPSTDAPPAPPAGPPPDAI